MNVSLDTTMDAIYELLHACILTCQTNDHLELPCIGHMQKKITTKVVGQQGNCEATCIGPMQGKVQISLKEKCLDGDGASAHRWSVLDATFDSLNIADWLETNDFEEVFLAGPLRSYVKKLNDIYEGTFLEFEFHDSSVNFHKNYAVNVEEDVHIEVMDFSTEDDSDFQQGITVKLMVVVHHTEKVKCLYLLRQHLHVMQMINPKMDIELVTDNRKSNLNKPFQNEFSTFESSEKETANASLKGWALASKNIGNYLRASSINIQVGFVRYDYFPLMHHTSCILPLDRDYFSDNRFELILTESMPKGVQPASDIILTLPMRNQQFSSRSISAKMELLICIQVKLLHFKRQEEFSKMLRESPSAVLKSFHTEINVILQELLQSFIDCSVAKKKVSEKLSKEMRCLSSSLAGVIQTSRKEDFRVRCLQMCEGLNTYQMEDMLTDKLIKCVLKENTPRTSMSTSHDISPGANVENEELNDLWYNEIFAADS